MCAKNEWRHKYKLFLEIRNVICLVLEINYSTFLLLIEEVVVVVDELKLFFHSYNISNDADSKSLLIENTHIERTSGYEKRTLSIRWPLPRFYRSPH